MSTKLEFRGFRLGAACIGGKIHLAQGKEKRGGAVEIAG
jgi:hypothetical protein